VIALDPAHEQALLARLHGSDTVERERAFDDLFRIMRAPLFGLCLQMTRRRAEAEDALQETFLSVHRHIKNFRGDSRLSTWIWRIAIHAAIRVRARTPQHASIEADAHASEDEALAHESRDHVHKAFDTLNAEQRLVLSLFAVEGLSHKDIAELLGLPEGTVWSRLHGARKRLAAQLQITSMG
jgi:RNA polymerase sigma-70 factor (ECF subfamily)